MNLNIAFIFYYLVDDMKAKWKNLKDTYMAHKRDYEKKMVSGAGQVSEPTWRWWKYFDFMRSSKARA